MTGMAMRLQIGFVLLALAVGCAPADDVATAVSYTHLTLPTKA